MEILCALERGWQRCLVSEALYEGMHIREGLIGLRIRIVLVAILGRVFSCIFGMHAYFGFTRPRLLL
jgi:hypothetical protein